MQLIMAQVNKVSTEARHPVEGISEITSTVGSNVEESSKSEMPVENIGSEIANIANRNVGQENAPRGTATHEETTSRDNIEEEETDNEENTNCSMDRVSDIPLQKNSVYYSASHASKNGQIEEVTSDENFVDQNECSESDSGIQQHYESMDFASQNMYQDESGYSYYYEDVHYDEDDDSESDEELEEYSHLGNQISSSHLYPSLNAYTKEQVESIYELPTQEVNNIAHEHFNEEYAENYDIQNEKNGDIEVLQNEKTETFEVCLNGYYCLT